ncbi:MAG: imidazolonepropionase [Micropepsaceae bacterium]
MEKWDHLWINARLATMREGTVPYGAIENAALGSKDGLITFAGPMSELPGKPEALADEVTDADNAWITPGLIDCHTHMVFAGNRATEFEMRLQGKSYEDISRAGGGIMSTVRATRDAHEATLTEECIGRLEALGSEGVTTIEIKSGYGLDQESELRLLSAAKRAAQKSGFRLSSTFLGLHALPPGVNRKTFVDEMSGPVLEAVARSHLATAVDAYCEGIAFTPGETRQFFRAATALGLKTKLHADQLSDTGGAGLAAEFRSLSADHLEHAREAGIAAMAKAGTVAVLLPAAFFYLRETTVPPVDLLRKHNVPIAIATDCNPGTSPVTSLLSVMAMACTLFRLTPEEVLAGVTRNAARALDMLDIIGTLTVGKSCDFAVWPVSHPSELCYWIGRLTPNHIQIGKYEPDQ